MLRMMDSAEDERKERYKNKYIVDHNLHVADMYVFMKTIICGATDPLRLRKEKKPLLVFLHGFAGSGALYYKLFQKLMTRFVLVTIDMVGMGGSSRPDNFNWRELSP